jgi:hypothetical protein
VGQLVARLLERIAPETESFRSGSDDPAPEAIAKFVERTISTLGPLGAAGVAKAHLGDEYVTAVADALLRGFDAETLVPGPTARAIARFVLDSGAPICVLTTNYDRLAGCGAGYVRLSRENRCC